MIFVPPERTNDNELSRNRISFHFIASQPSTDTLNNIHRSNTNTLSRLSSHRQIPSRTLKCSGFELWQSVRQNNEYIYIILLFSLWCLRSSTFFLFLVDIDRQSCPTLSAHTNASRRVSLLLFLVSTTSFSVRRDVRRVFRWRMAEERRKISSSDDMNKWPPLLKTQLIDWNDSTHLNKRSSTQVTRWPHGISASSCERVLHVLPMYIVFSSLSRLPCSAVTNRRMLCSADTQKWNDALRS